MAKRYWPTIPLAIFLALAVFFEWSSANLPHPNSKPNSDQQADSRPINNNPSVFFTTGTWFGDHHDTVEALAAAFSAIFTVALVGANVALWRVTRTAANAAKEAADAATQAANAAKAQTKIAERSLTEIERAFIYLDGFETEITTGEDVKGTKDEDLPEKYRGSPDLYITRFAVAPKWRNSGRTPPKKLTIQVNWCGPEGNLVIPAYRDIPIPLFVGPNAVETSAIFEIPGARAIVDWSWHPVGDQPLVLVWGRADYEDIFDRHHFVEWCYKLTFSRPFPRFRIRAVFTQWGDYNRTDNPAA